MSRSGVAPPVSIGMPVYNGERHLTHALDSLLAQTHTDFELVISDNASTDATPDICSDYSARDPRVTHSRAPETTPAVANFNRVLGLCHGRHFLWAAADDTWEPGFVADLHERLNSDPGISLAFTLFDHIDDDGAHVRDHPGILELMVEDTAERLRRYVVQPGPAGKANLVYGMSRRATLVQLGGMRGGGPRDWGVDMVLVLRLLALGRLSIAPEVLFHKRITADTSPPPQGTVGRAKAAAALVADWHAHARRLAHVVRSAGLSPVERRRLLAAVARVTAAQDAQLVRAALGRRR